MSLEVRLEVEWVPVSPDLLGLPIRASMGLGGLRNLSPGLREETEKEGLEAAERLGSSFTRGLDGRDT